MTLPEACSFFQDLTQVPAALLSGTRQQALFAPPTSSILSRIT